MLIKRKKRTAAGLSKEKRILMLEKIIGIAVCLLVVVWIGFSVYSKATDKAASVTKETVLDTTALDEYTAGINSDETVEGENVEEKADETAE